MFAADLNRRGKRRHPYFQPVQIRYGEDGVETLEAHSRNISPNGIGLFHIGAPQEEQAILTVSKSAFESIQLRAKLAWSEECKRVATSAVGNLFRFNLENFQICTCRSSG